MALILDAGDNYQFSRRCSNNARPMVKTLKEAICLLQKNDLSNPFNKINRSFLC